MATVIDQLIVELQLDPKKFSAGQREAVKDLRRFERDTERHTQAVGSQTQKLEQSFAALQGRLLSIASLFLGGMGIRAFTEHITRLTSATGYLATNLGVSTKELGTWQGVAGSVGASAGEIAQGFASIRRNMANFQLHGESPLNRFSAATHQAGNGPAVGLYERNGEWRSATDILLDMSRWAAAQKSPAIASQGLATSGMSEGMINLLMLGPQELQKRLKEYEKFAPSQDDVRKFQELQEAMAKTAASAEKLGRSIVLVFSPGLIKFMDSLARIVEAFGKGGWWEGLKTLEDEASKGVGEATKSVGVDASATGEKANQGWWGRFKSKFEWHNPFTWKKGANEPLSMTGDGPGGSSVPTSSPGRVPGQPGAPAGGQTGGGSGSSSSDAASGPGSSEFLRQRRQRYADEIANTPGLRDRVGGMLALEGTAQPTMESLLNRIDYVNTERAKRSLPPKSIDDMLNSGFYGPINRGQLPSGMNTYRRNPAKFDRAIDRALGGSHIIGGYTDQGLPTDPNGSIRNAQRGLSFPYKKIGGNEFTDWAGGPGRRAATSYREMIETGLAKEKADAQAQAKAPAPSNATKQPDLAGRADVRVRPTTSNDLVSTPASRTFDNWGALNSLNLGSRGALLGGNSSSVTNTRNHTTHIENMNVAPPPGASPAEYGGGIRQELNRYDNVMNANQGLL